jgi:hypothetical protein
MVHTRQPTTAPTKVTAAKEETVRDRQSNLPLPEQPPAASDWNSADSRTVNVGSGGVSADISAGDGSSAGLREPATADSAVRTSGEERKTNTAGAGGGRQAKDGLGGLPNDAVTRDAKGSAKTVETTGEDYGYPQKSDPSSGLG